jgi:hypothetical protein
VDKKNKKILDSVKYVAKGILLPATFKQIPIYLVFWSVLQPLTGMLFPTAADVLKQEGLNPELGQELAPDKKIYIRQGDSLIAKAHAMLDSGFLGLPMRYLGMRDSSGTDANTTRGIISGRFENIIESPLCTIYIKPRKYFEDHTEYGGTDPQTQYQKALLHEIRHCSAENRKLPNDLYVEGDAEYRAIKTLARERKDSALLTTLFNMTAIIKNPTESHNTSLYIDARLHGQIPPSDIAILQANSDVADLIMPVGMGRIVKENGACALPVSKIKYKCLDEDAINKSLSPLAQKRLAFGVQAVKSIANSSLKTAAKPSGIS